MSTTGSGTAIIEHCTGAGVRRGQLPIGREYVRRYRACAQGNL